ncbi:transcriptional repressor [Desulfitobacterium hafniense]|uniref:Fur family transcriptional regulator n=1 Tax=Desulfitobacterium hafniense TaxID=49338 RepID=UPI000363FBBD
MQLLKEVTIVKEVNNNWPAGVKRTKPRESVLSVLEHAPKPLSAVEICSEIEKEGESPWLSTIYRILELFVKKGVVVKLAVLNNEMALYELNRFQHKHYAICLGCHKIVTMNNCPMEKFIPKIEDDGFRVLGHNLEVYGYCRECSVK